MHFAEHGLSPNPMVVKWQERLTPFPAPVGTRRFRRQNLTLEDADPEELSASLTLHFLTSGPSDPQGMPYVNDLGVDGVLGQDDDSVPVLSSSPEAISRSRPRWYLCQHGQDCSDSQDWFAR
jgi:hypothetical protein